MTSDLRRELAPSETARFTLDCGCLIVLYENPRLMGQTPCGREDCAMLAASRALRARPWEPPAAALIGVIKDGYRPRRPR